MNGVRSWHYRGYDNSVEASFDDGGKNVSANRYSAFGKRISDVGVANNREAFQGLDFRPTVDQYNLGARTMYSEDGRWGQPEPLMVSGLDPEQLENPMLYNSYRYAANNPVVLTDPKGFDPVLGGNNYGGPPRTAILTSEEAIGLQVMITSVLLTGDSIVQGWFDNSMVPVETPLIAPVRTPSFTASRPATVGAKIKFTPNELGLNGYSKDARALMAANREALASQNAGNLPPLPYGVRAFFQKPGEVMVVPRPNIKISGQMTGHALYRAVERQVSWGSIKSALINPRVVLEIPHHGGFAYVGERATVAVSAKTGNIVTVIGENLYTVEQRAFISFIKDFEEAMATGAL